MKRTSSPADRDTLLLICIQCAHMHALPFPLAVVDVSIDCSKMARGKHMLLFWHSLLSCRSPPTAQRRKDEGLTTCTLPEDGCFFPLFPFHFHLSVPCCPSMMPPLAPTNEPMRPCGLIQSMSIHVRQVFYHVPLSLVRALSLSILRSRVVAFRCRSYMACLLRSLVERKSFAQLYSKCSLWNVSNCRRLYCGRIHRHSLSEVVTCLLCSCICVLDAWCSYSMKYHRLYPDYIHERLKATKRNLKLGILLVHVDIGGDCQNILRELSRVSIIHEWTLILVWR